MDRAAALLYPVQSGHEILLGLHLVRRIRRADARVLQIRRVARLQRRPRRPRKLLRSPVKFFGCDRVLLRADRHRLRQPVHELLLLLETLPQSRHDQRILAAVRVLHRRIRQRIVIVGATDSDVQTVPARGRVVRVTVAESALAATATGGIADRLLLAGRVPHPAAVQIRRRIRFAIAVALAGTARGRASGRRQYPISVAAAGDMLQRRRPAPRVMVDGVAGHGRVHAPSEGLPVAGHFGGVHAEPLVRFRIVSRFAEILEKNWKK